jgi:hypothetical protein
MTLLDTAIDRYFSATNANNNQLAAECFDPDASVFDEGQQLTGINSALAAAKPAKVPTFGSGTDGKAQLWRSLGES